MSFEPPNKDREIEERLADFTDKVLSGKTPVEQPGEDLELAGLAKTVEKIKSMVDRDVPDPLLAHRIDTRLKKSWQLDHAKSEKKTGFWQKILSMRLVSRPWFQLASVAALLVIILLFVFPDRLGNLPATAAQNPGLVFGLVIGLAAVIIIILVVTNRN